MTQVVDGYSQQEEVSSRKFESEEPPFLTMFETVTGALVSMTLLFVVCAVVMYLLKLQHALELAELAKKEKREEEEHEEEEEEEQEEKPKGKEGLRKRKEVFSGEGNGGGRKGKREFAMSGKARKRRKK